MRKSYFSIAAFLVGLIAFAGAQETITSGEWKTNSNFKEGAVVLHWTHIYEGKDTVYKIEVKPRRGPVTSFKVQGQPVFNAARTHVALPYCADDGCAAEIEVVDLVTRRKLSPINLSYEGQFYVECEWVGNVLRVAVEYSFTADGKSESRTHQFVVSPSGSIREQKLQ